MADRHEMIERMKARLGEVDTGIARVRRKLSGAGEEAAERHRGSLEELRDDRGRMAGEIERRKSGAEDARWQVRDRSGAARRKLPDGVARAMKRLRGR